MTKTKPNERDWTARRSGALYCAPACGGGCTWEAYQEAKRQGQALAKACGPGYKSVVHENLGWYFRAVSPCERIQVFKYGKEYHAGLGDAGEVAMRYVGAYFSNPKKAIADVIAVAKADLALIVARLEGL